MKIFLQFIGLTGCMLALACSVFVLAGCEWQAAGADGSWNTSALSTNAANFSGSYKDPNGGIVVRQFGSETAQITNTVANELLATGNGTNTSFSGQTAFVPVGGSLTIIAGGYRITDAAAATAETVALTVTPADGSTGTFNYSTRTWTLNFTAPLANGTQVLADYQYAVVIPVQGNHGKAIYALVVYQMGNKLQIIDNNGATYEGTLGFQTTSDAVAQFSATGVSQGYNVTLVGVLQDTYMRGTYIEEGGYEADLYAVRQ